MAGRIDPPKFRWNYRRIRQLVLITTRQIRCQRRALVALWFRIGNSRRVTCEFCRRPNRWPDLCVDSDPRFRGSTLCSREISWHCGQGDHRRCGDLTCGAINSWGRKVRVAGIEAMQADGSSYAIVSRMKIDMIEVLGTFDDLDDARQNMPIAPLIRAGWRLDSHVRSSLYIVRYDGEFF